MRTIPLFLTLGLNLIGYSPLILGQEATNEPYTGKWDLLQPGMWFDPYAWYPNTPNAVDDIASFYTLKPTGAVNNANGNLVVTLDNSVTLGQLWVGVPSSDPDQLFFDDPEELSRINSVTLNSINGSQLILARSNSEDPVMIRAARGINLNAQLVTAGDLYLSGGGGLILNADNSETFSGRIIVSEGTVLGFTSNAALGAPLTNYRADSIMLDGGTIVNMKDAYTNTLGSVAFSSLNNFVIEENHGITLGDNGGTFRLGFAAGTGAVHSIITGSGNLTKADIGHLTLTANNSYAGNTIITGGYGNYVSRLQIGNGGTSGTLGAGEVQFDGALNELIFNRSDDHTVTNRITGLGRVVISGTGVTIFTAANNYTGGTHVLEGATLQVGNGTGNNTAHIGSGRLVLDGNIVFARTNTIGSYPTIQGVVSGAGDITINSGSIRFTNQNNTFTGNILVKHNAWLHVANNGALGNANSITFDGGNLFNTGNSTVTIDASRTILMTNAGMRVRVGYNADARIVFESAIRNETGTGAYNVMSFTVLNDIGSVVLSNSNNSWNGYTIVGGISSGTSASLILGADNVLPDTSQLQFNAGVTLIPATEDTPASIVHHTATLDMNGFNDAVRNIFSNVVDTAGIGIITNNKADTLSTLTILGEGNDATYRGFFHDGAGQIAVHKTGEKFQILLGENTYSGGTLISNGQLRVGSDAALGLISSKVTLAGGELVNHADNIVTLDQQRVIEIATGKQGKLRAISSKRFTVNSLITGSGDLQIINDSGHVALGNQQNDYTGRTIIGSSTRTGNARLALDSNEVLPNNTIVEFQLEGTSQSHFDLNSKSETIAGLSTNTSEANLENAASRALVTNYSTSAATLTLLTQAQNGTQDFVGRIQNGNGSVAIVVDGDGAQRFNSYSTYSGGTTLRGGTTILNYESQTAGSILGVGNVHVIGENAVLAGTGAISLSESSQFTMSAGTLRVGETHGGSSLAPSQRILSLGHYMTTNHFDIAITGGQLQFDVALHNAGDLLELNTTGNVNFENVDVAINGLDHSDWYLGDTFQLIDWSFADQAQNISLSSFNLIDQIYGDHRLELFIDNEGVYQGLYAKVVVIPEPSRMLLLALGFSGLVLRRRR